MQKIKIFLLAVLTTFCASTSAQQSTFQVIADLGASENACDLQQTADGGFIVSGLQFSGSATSMKIFLMKFAADGTSQWSKTYTGAVANGANMYHNYRVIVTKEGGFLVVGTTSVGGNDIFVMKTDALGDTLWTRTYGSGGSDDGNSIFETPNGDFVIGGSCMLGGQRRMGFLRINASGALVAQSFHADGVASPWFEYLRLSDNEIGIVHSYTSLLAVVDSMGLLQWTMPIGLGSAYSVDAARLSNGEYLVLGLNSGLVGGAYALLRANSSGTLSLQKKYSTSYDESPRNLLVTPGGDYVFFGLSTSMNGPSALMACKVDANGNVLWSNRYSYSANSNHEAGRMIRTADGGYAMLGQYDRSGNYTDFDVYLVKTDSLGQSGCNQQAFTFNTGTVNPVGVSPYFSYSGSFSNTGTPFATSTASVMMTNYLSLCSSTSAGLISHQPAVSLYPNPAADRLRIASADRLYVSYQLSDLSGRTLLHGAVPQDLEIDLSGLPEGIFLLRLKDEEGNAASARLVHTGASERH
ncbi:MAG: hypothetical protein RL213_342 [Bacteroidota bacterium]|jgi:hypothetical protein